MKKQANPQIILASQSQFRKELLARLKQPFSCITSHVDETPLRDEHPDATALRLSELKAKTVLEKHPNAIVIGSDQVAYIQEGDNHFTRFGKPLNKAKAQEQLLACSARTVTFVTGLWIGHKEQHLSTCVHTQITYKKITEHIAQQYINLDDPLQCAGSIKSESMGIALIESQKGDDPSALVGLPLIKTCDFLSQLGVDLFNQNESNA